MTQEDIIRMAREAFIARGFWPNEVMWACWRDAWLAGAAAENEACAKVCDAKYAEYPEIDPDYAFALAASDLAKTIRARGQA
jgi:hypothetical protein